ncbi:alcohol dehydrogenase [Chitinophaga caeni]|uniref:alcohol dehydrogenase n=1 Tax=Chitinophaga caeni TaxID=2029983 RepID=A0A291QWL4_9BACT|nr:zinc-binding dehydrogenase [Chitinophaga caeni]ATL48348.1 alcohol dehydrogenase [Chitinophaga caeni]
MCNPSPAYATSMVFSDVGKPLEAVTIPIPTTSNEEVLVKIEYTTICTSDVHTYLGRRHGPMPCVLGHEIIGRITAKGTGIDTDFAGENLQVGDLVTWCVYAFDPHGNTMALRGMPQKSPGLYKYGHQEFTLEDGLNGGFSTHCVLKKGTAIFKLPGSLTPREAAPINCTHATIAGALRLAGNVKNKNVLVTGCGMLGLSACAMSKEAAAAKVVAMDINRGRLEMATRFGAENTPVTKEFDIVIDTTGVPAVMERGLSCLNTGGTAVWVGAVYSQPATLVNAEMIVKNLLTIKGLHNYTPDDLAQAINFIKKHRRKYPFDGLVGKEFPLEQIDEALQQATRGQYYRLGICS